MNLDDRIRNVLAELSTLSEAPTANLDPDRHHGAPDSSIPAGVSLRNDPTKPPPKERSLYDWYRWQFANARDEEHRARLCTLAEFELAERRSFDPDRMDLRRGALTDNDVRDGGTAERAHAKRIVDWYEGTPSIVVAFIEKQTESWVRKARRQHKRDPDTGRQRPAFLDWEDDERRRQIDLLIAREWNEHRREIGAKAIADHFGVAKNTIRRYLEPVEAAA